MNLPILPTTARPVPAGACPSCLEPYRKVELPGHGTLLVCPAAALAVANLWPGRDVECLRTATERIVTAMHDEGDGQDWIEINLEDASRTRRLAEDFAKAALGLK